MRSRLLLVVVAVALGAAAAFLSLTYLDRQRARISAESKPVEVLVAAQDVPAGLTADEIVRKGMAVREPVPGKYVASGALSSVRTVDGQVLAAGLTKGEQLTSARFRYPADAGLSHTVPKDYVAVTIPTDESRGLGALLKPGDEVAVIGTVVNGGEGQQDSKTKVLIPKVRVLAVGSDVGATSDGDQTEKKKAGFGQGQSQGRATQTVTLALSSADAERLVLVQEKGKVWLALLPATAPAGATPHGQVLSTVLN